MSYVILTDLPMLKTLNRPSNKPDYGCEPIADLQGTTTSIIRILELKI